MTSGALRILGDRGSGNCLKVLWVAEHLRLPYEWVDVDVTTDRSEARATRQADFLLMNPFGEIPVVRFADGRTLAQSNAILRFLARGSALLPDDAFAQAKIDEWLFWEQYSHEPYIAVCRFQLRYLKRHAEERDAWRVERGEAALGLLDRTFERRAWLANDMFSIADVALLAYTRLAPEGGFDLEPRPHLRRWISRCEAELGLNPIQAAA